MDRIILDYDGYTYRVDCNGRLRCDGEYMREEGKPGTVTFSPSVTIEEVRDFLNRYTHLVAD